MLLLDPAIEEELQSCFGDGGRTISDQKRADGPGDPAHGRFFEKAKWGGRRNGMARASVSESGAISHSALAGTGSTSRDGTGAE